jgi:hypothetical protein
MKNKGRADDMCSETRKGIEENKKKWWEWKIANKYIMKGEKERKRG